MATWGSWVHNYTYTPTNSKKYIRLGYDLSASHNAEKNAVTWNVTVYLQDDYSINDQTNTFSISGTWNQTVSNTNVVLSSSTMAVYSNSWTQYGLGPGSYSTASFDASMSGLFSFGATASVSGSGGYTIPANTPTMGTTSATAGVRYIDVSWSVANNGGAGIDTYHVYKNGVFTWSFTNGETSLRDTSVPNNTTASYVVYAHNSAGWSGASNTASATTPNVPGIPVSPSANTSTFGTVTLNWTTPSNGGRAIDSYTIKRDGVVLSSTVSGSATSYSDTTVEPSKTYIYEIIAVNAVGPSLPASLTVLSLGGVVNVLKTLPNTYSKILPKIWLGSEQGWKNAQARMWNSSEWKHGT